MFKIGNIVQHRTTAKVGKVVGYGCRVVDHTYSLTLKVRPLRGVDFKPLFEDSMGEWRLLGLHSPKLIHRDSLQGIRVA